MLGKLFYLCPSCYEEDSLVEFKHKLTCKICQVSFPFEQGKVLYCSRTYTIPEFYRLIRNRLNFDKHCDQEIRRVSKKAVLRQGLKKINFRGHDHSISIIECPVVVDQGILIFKANQFILRGDQREWIFEKSGLRSFTTNSDYFEFKYREQLFYQIDFEQESPLKYEDLFKLWFQSAPNTTQLIEHQPKIISQIPAAPKLLLSVNQIEDKTGTEKFSLPERFLHLFVGLPILWFLKFQSHFKFSHKELVPKQGPFVVIMNHESYLDPIILSTILSRRIGFLTKSTTFATRFLQPVLRAYRSLPNRRYQTDPHVIRLAIRTLKKGHCIGIFPEGERTWDGCLLPFKLSTIKFLLSIQVPLVIARISGAYKVLPRWSHRIYPGCISIDIQRVFSLIPGKWTINEFKQELESYYR